MQSTYDDANAFGTTRKTGSIYNRLQIWVLVARQDVRFVSVDEPRRSADTLAFNPTPPTFSLPSTRYGLFDFEYMHQCQGTSESSKKQKLFLMSWCPDTAKVPFVPLC